MASPITVSNMTQTGRINVGDPKAPRIKLTYTADFTADADITFDFQAQKDTFKNAQSMFVDNSTNPSEIVVTVSNTQTKFRVPPYAQGVWNIDTTQLSTVALYTIGGATEKSTITFYNYVVPPSVWYRFGTFNVNLALKSQGAMLENSNIAAQSGNNAPVYVGGKGTDGLLHGLKVDNTGRLEVIGSAAGGTVYGPDAVGVAPTQAPLLVSGVDGGGLIRRLLTSVAGALQVDISGLVTGGAARLVTASGNYPISGTDGINARQILTNASGVIQVDIENANTYVRTSVVATVADTPILSTNASRRSVKLFNDSTSIMLLGFGPAAVSLTDYSLQIPPGGYFECQPQDAGSELRAYWIAANGKALITTGV